MANTPQIHVPSKLELAELQKCFQDVQKALRMINDGDLNMGGHRVVGLGRGLDSSDAVTVSQLIALLSDSDFKQRILQIVRPLLPRAVDPVVEYVEEFDRMAGGTPGGWNVVGTGSATSQTAIADHSGITQVASSAISGEITSLAFSNTATRVVTLPEDVELMEWVVQAQAGVSQQYRLGLQANVNTAGGGDGVYFEFNSTGGDTTWRCVTKSGGVETRGDSGVTVTAGNWYVLRLTQQAAGEWTFTVNEDFSLVQSTNVPTAGGNIAATVETNSAAVKSLWLDRFRLRYLPVAQRYT